jgi:hypothetical protein
MTKVGRSLLFQQFWRRNGITHNMKRATSSSNDLTDTTTTKRARTSSSSTDECEEEVPIMMGTSSSNGENDNARTSYEVPNALTKKGKREENSEKEALRVLRGMTAESEAAACAARLAGETVADRMQGDNKKALLREFALCIAKGICTEARTREARAEIIRMRNSK